MTVKKDLLAEINKKAQKIRDKRVDAANNKGLEAIVSSFFKNVEECRNIHGNDMYDPNLFTQAKKSMDQRISSIDRRAKTSIEWHTVDANKSWEYQQVRGVTVWWSNAYILTNKVDPSVYIDISQMLLL